jgi:hypothetical protein
MFLQLCTRIRAIAVQDRVRWVLFDRLGVQTRGTVEVVICTSHVRRHTRKAPFNSRTHAGVHPLNAYF